jgi:hypothetical protein
MEMEKRILQMLELLLARQEEAAACQEKAHADAKAHQEKATAELKAAILASFRGSTTYQTETTSCPGEMDATGLVNTEET